MTDDGIGNNVRDAIASGSVPLMKMLLKELQTLQRGTIEHRAKTAEHLKNLDAHLKKFETNIDYLRKHIPLEPS